MDDRVIEAERKLTERREQLRTLERQAQEATFGQRSLQARQAELQRTLANRRAAKRRSGEEQRARAGRGRGA